jgi:hypothetical protein
MEDSRKLIEITPQAHKLLSKEAKRLYAASLKDLASRALLLALKDPAIRAQLKVVV